MNRRHIAAIVGVLLVAVGVAALAILDAPGPNETSDLSDQSPQYVSLSFSGNLETSAGFEADGYVHFGDAGVGRDGVDEVSFRLYDENGSLLYGECLGRVETTDRIPVSHTRRDLPEYVIVMSPSLWPEESYPAIADYWVLYEDEYGYRGARRPSSYPVDVSRHDPCAS